MGRRTCKRILNIKKFKNFSSNNYDVLTFIKQLFFVREHNEMLMDETVNTQDGGSLKTGLAMIINC